MITVLTWAEAYFDAAHHQPFGERVHGHTWHVRAWVPEGPDNRDLGGELQAVIAPLDHVLLDQIEGLVPSNEGIARWILERMPSVIRVDVNRRGGGATATR